MSAAQRGKQFLGIPLVINQQEWGGDQKVTAHFPGETHYDQEAELSFNDYGRGGEADTPQRGKIRGVWVPEEHRRKGVATAMLAYALKTSSETKALPAHSGARTDEAEKWAQSTKDFIDVTPRTHRAETGEKL